MLKYDSLLNQNNRNRTIAETDCKLNHSSTTYTDCNTETLILITVIEAEQ